MFTKKHGNFVNMIGVTDVGDPSVCILSDKFFIDSTNSGVLLKKSRLPWSWFGFISVVGHTSSWTSDKQGPHESAFLYGSNFASRGQ
jgi:hypothetical protein